MFYQGVVGYGYRPLACVLAVNTRTVSVMLAIMPPQGCEAILIEILQPKRDCLFHLARNIAVEKTDDKICNNALFHTNLARPRSIIVRIQMLYLDLLYISLLMRKQRVKCGPVADRLCCSPPMYL